MNAPQITTRPGVSWNVRYVEFAESNGRTAEQQYAHDMAQDGATMTDFVCWMTRTRSHEWSENKRVTK